METFALRASFSVQWLCHPEDAFVAHKASCPHNDEARGVTNEPFSEITTNDKALPVSQRRDGCEVERCFHVLLDQQGCEVFEFNVQADHAHLRVMVPSRVASLSLRVIRIFAPIVSFGLFFETVANQGRLPEIIPAKRRLRPGRTSCHTDRPTCR